MPQKLKNKKLPHYGVFTRLGKSKKHGVGVFAIKDIKKGVYIFYGDDEDMVWVSKEAVDKLKDENIKKLYSDFGPIKKNKYGCPKNFNQLTVSWYLNESKKPNVGCDKNYNFYALKDIKKSKELTTDYSTYDER